MDLNACSYRVGMELSDQTASFSCHPARVHTFWPGEERHMFRGCAAVHYGIAPHMYPIPKGGRRGEETHARDVAHGEHAHGEGVKCFRVKMKNSGVQRGTSPFSSGSYSLYRSPKSVGKSNPPEHQAAASFQPSISTGISPLSVFSPLEPTHVLSDCPSGISHTWYRCKLKASRCAHFDPLSSSHAFLSAINPAAGAAESQFSFDFVPLDIEATSARGGPDSHLCLHSLNEAFVTVMILILILIICRG